MEKNINKVLEGSHKLTNMLHSQISPYCKMGLGGHNNEGEFNKHPYLCQGFYTPQRILHYGGKHIKEEDHLFVTFVAKKDIFN